SAILDLTGSDGPIAVFDATGNAESMEQSIGYAASGGRVVFVGLVRERISFSDPEFHRRELTLLATRNSTASDFKRIIGLMEDGTIDTGSWITHRASADAMIGRFDSWTLPECAVIKAVVEF